MAQKKVVLDSQDDLKTVLRRMTTKVLRELRESTGQTNFTDCRSLFQFSNYTIANEIGGTSAQVAEIIRLSDLEHFTYRGSLIVWLEDLDERLAKFAC
ncbi:hypothetical protein [Vibrio metschnikovii]|uniref:hypothetical protein n=1 Tax=Vibrio metschnikovii TaxID=28172 RepID=UPI001C310CE1|nr:hypothetical protein [Vibrio metschnikovii]